ncbi:alpha/beta-hydrolase, partial [Bimuria novae-zelandiae CBS 107.79]
DVVTFYRYVLDQGVDPRNIFISGDSAGGAVAIALLRYIEETKVLPSTRGVMLWSPWLDVSSSAVSRYSKSKSLRTDFLNLGLIEWGKSAFQPVPRSEEQERYLCPAAHAFRSQTPVFVNAGTAEILHEEITEFVRNMDQVDGNKMCYVETKDAPHDVLCDGSVWKLGPPVRPVHVTHVIHTVYSSIE